MSLMDLLNKKSILPLESEALKGREEEIEVPFPELILNIDMKSNANEEQFNKIKAQLKMYCPISKVITNSGTIITENWNKV